VEITADCPDGESIMGGGADVVSAQNGGTLSSLAPVDGPDDDTKLDDAFTMHAYNSTLQAGNATVWAMCAPGKTRVVAVTKPLKRNKTVGLHAACPKGTLVSGGGALASGLSEEVFLNATQPWDSGDDGKLLDNGWQVKASNVEGAKKNLTGYALCRPDLTLNPFVSLGVFEPGSDSSFVQNCANENLSVSGAGAKIGGKGSLTRLSAAYPFDDVSDDGEIPDDGVVMEGENLTGQAVPGGPAAVCLR
jgi:hypothetical protein